MALKLIRIGSATDVFQYDDGAFPVAIHTEGPMQADTAPTNPNEVLRLADVPASANIVTAAANITDHAVVRGDGGAKGIQDSLVTIDDGGSISLLALQTVDGVDLSVHAATPTAHQDAPGLIATHTAIPAAHHAKYTDAEAVIAAKADGDIADAITKKHTQGTDTALGAVGTKNPPINADKILYRDSAAADVLVTSTWTQIKAFLKTYFDTLYNLYVHPNHSGDVTSVADGATSIVVNIPSDEHLVGYWAFDDGSGTVAVDGSGNGNNGTLVNMEDADWVDGIVGKCLSFDGVAEYVELPDSEVFNFGTGEFSISFWFNAPGQSTNYPTCITTQGGWSAGTFGIRYDNAGANDKVTIHWNPEGDPVISSTNTFTNNVWHHVVATRSGTSLKLYVNGVLEGSATVNVARVIDLAYGGSVRIGWGTWDGAQGYFDGKQSEFRIYKGYVLAVSEIKALYLYPAGSKGCKISALQINGPLVTYANNAAAIAGGLVVGDLYCNGADPDLVCIVH